MRKVFSGLFISLDGVTESPDQWQFDHFDEGMMAGMSALLANQDAMLLGRVTYQEWADYWPTSTDEPFASFINSIPKYVVSTTLESVTWSNSTLLSGDLAAEIARLKQQPGKDISITGSGTLVRTLLRDGLLDELRLLVHPIVVGHGKRLFPDGEQIPLALQESTTFGTGVLSLTYRHA